MAKKLNRKTLLNALKDDDIQTLKQCLDAGVSPNCTFLLGNNAFEYALNKKKYEIAFMLLSYGARRKNKIIVINSGSVCKLGTYFEYLVRNGDVDKPYYAEMLEQLKDIDPKFICYNNLTSCMTAALKAGRKNNFLYHLKKVEDYAELVREEAGIQRYADSEVLIAYEAKKRELAGRAKALIEDKKIQNTEDPKAFFNGNNQTLEINYVLSEGKILSEVFNFETCRLTTFVSDGQNISPPTIQEFGNIINQDCIKKAAEKLKEQGGNPGQDWRKHLTHKPLPRKVAGTSVSP